MFILSNQVKKKIDQSAPSTSKRHSHYPIVINSLSNEKTLRLCDDIILLLSIINIHSIAMWDERMDGDKMN